MSATDWRNVSLWFLIHYGWRGTNFFTPQQAIVSEFLIHYGWRGTFGEMSDLVREDLVSNPLRLEGDTSHKGSELRKKPVSNPLRLEGDLMGLLHARRIGVSF